MLYLRSLCFRTYRRSARGSRVGPGFVGPGFGGFRNRRSPKFPPGLSGIIRKPRGLSPELLRNAGATGPWPIGPARGRGHGDTAQSPGERPGPRDNFGSSLHRGTLPRGNHFGSSLHRGTLSRGNFLIQNVAVFNIKTILCMEAYVLTVNCACRNTRCYRKSNS